MGTDQRGMNGNNLRFYWWIALPSTVKLEFMPSISKIGSNVWQNMSWLEQSEYTFENLEPYTRYVNLMWILYVL